MKALGQITALLLFIAFGLACAMLSAFVLRDLWNWFVVGPLIVPPITWAEAYGLSIFISFLKMKAGDGKDDERTFGEELLHGVAKIIGYLIAAGLIWAIGAVVHAWVR